MAYKINELTGDQLEEILEKYPKSEPEKYQLVEVEGMSAVEQILSYHAFKDEAEAELIRWKGRDLITTKVERMIGECILDGQQFGLDPTEIRLMIKEGG